MTPDRMVLVRPKELKTGEGNRNSSRKGCLRFLARILLAGYAVACILILFLPFGGCATQAVVNMKLGQSAGREILFPPDTVTQDDTGTIHIAIWYRDTSNDRTGRLDVYLSAEEIARLVEDSWQTSEDGSPQVDLLECLLQGDLREISDVVKTMGTPLAGFPTRYPMKLVSNHELQVGDAAQTVVLIGCKRYYESWVLWPRPIEYVLRVPAACFDALTAVVQIPYYALKDFGETLMEYNARPLGNNPWERFKNPPHRHIPRLVDMDQHTLYLTEEMYDDILFDRVEGEDSVTGYRGYLDRFPVGRHAAEVKQLIEAARDREECKACRQSQGYIWTLRAYINAHPDSACINEGRTAFERMRNHVVVVRRESRDGEPGGESWSYPRPTKVFAVDRSRQSDVEEFLGKGVPVSLDTPSTGNALQWRAEFYRGEWLPRNCPLQYGGFPVKPLTLIFDGDGTLSEISGDGGMFALF